MSISLIKTGRLLNEVPDVGTCCQSNNINKWSLNKPVNYSSYNAIDDLIRASLNYGFRLFTRPSPQQMVYELQTSASTLWEYIDREDPFRLTDFDGYNHYASPLFDIQFVGGNSGVPGTTTLRIECMNSLEDFINDWAWFNGVRANIDVAAVFYPVGTQYADTVNRGIYVYKVAGMSDGQIESDHLSFKIPSGLALGDYEVRICLTTALPSTWVSGADSSWTYYTGSSSPALIGDWYALPQHSSLTFTASNSGGGGGQPSENYYNYVDFTFDNLSFTWNDPVLSDISFNCNLDVKNTHDTIKVMVDMYYDNAQSPVLLSSFSRTLQEDDVPSAIIPVNYRNQIYTMTGGRLDDGILSVRLDTRIQKGGTQQQKSWTVSIGE